MKILLAFDKFKNALTSEECNEVASAIIKEKLPSVEIINVPISDGGEGFVDYLSRLKDSPCKEVTVRNYLGKEQNAQYLILDDSTLIIEYATVCGLTLKGSLQKSLFERKSDALASLMSILIEKESPSKIILGIGGSGTQDLGEGFFKKALELNLQKIPIEIVSDVSTRGSEIYLYGEQKGMKREELTKWKEHHKRTIERINSISEKPLDFYDQHFLGASGGILFGILSYFDSVKIDLGADKLISEISQKGPFDYIFTGEGRVDAGSLEGKGAFFLAKNLPSSKKTFLFTGKCDIEKNQPFKIIEISDPTKSLEENIRYTKESLSRSILALDL